MLAVFLAVISAVLYCLAEHLPPDKYPDPVRHQGPRSPPPGDKVLRFPIEQRFVNGTAPESADQLPSIYRRGWGWKHLEDYRGYLYFMELEFGNPTQTSKMVIDTGSFEMWINPNCTAAASPAVCEQNGYYEPEISEYSNPMNRWFEFRYGTGFARGRYYTDSIYFRETDLAIYQIFGVANDSQYAISGIMGLGYGYGVNLEYPNILDSLVYYERINSPVFSIGLGGQGDGRSEIVFGGVNRYKYSGYPHPVTIWPTLDRQPHGWTHYWVNMSSVGMDKPSGVGEKYTTSDFNMNVLIDTGSTLTYLRADVVYVIAQQFQAWDDWGTLLVDCRNRDKNGTVNFGFDEDNIVIKVRYKDFVVKNQDGTCSLGVQVAAHDNVLGDTFIRGAYLVFDQTTHQIWMQNYKNCGDAVMEVGTNGDDIAYMFGFC